MSDVTVAPPSQAPSSPDTSAQNLSQPQSEVVINQNPTSSPNPIGSQAPAAPEGRTPSARESLQRAFDRASNPPPKGERPPQRATPKPAEAKPGHNQPPEETPRLDLKKRPEDQPGVQAVRDRGEHGHFAPRATNGARNVATNGAEQVANGEQKPYKTLPEHAPFAAPPPRVSERARRDWADTPETVRGDMYRLHQEADGIYRRYRADHEAMQPIRHFHELARSQGTTLDKALNSYISMEAKLRQDVVGGLDVIVNNLNMVRQDGSRVTLRDVAYHILSQSPEQLQQVQQGNQLGAAGQQIGALHQEIQGLKSYVQQMQYQQQFASTRSAVDRYADTHPRLDELGELIKQELALGFDLDQAYRRAELLQPATHADQTRTTSAQTRQPTDRSISGSPAVAPSNGAARRRQPSGSAREALQNAMRAHGGF
jgi:hypothetical protein